MFGLELVCLGALIIIGLVWLVRDPEGCMGCFGCGFLIVILVVVALVIAGANGIDALGDALSNIW